MALNIEQARFNMIEQQIRTWEVLDERVLDALKAVPREEFVPSKYRRMAFMDVRVPLGEGQVMLKPVEEGRLLQALNLSPGQTVLEVGTGYGFLTACLAELGGQVMSLEIYPRFVEAAQGRLTQAGVDDVAVVEGDALDADFMDSGVLGSGQFDCVVATSSAATVPEGLMRRVAIGGRLVVIRGHSPAMEAVCLHRQGQDQWVTESLFETDVPRLIGAEDVEQFEF